MKGFFDNFSFSEFIEGWKNDLFPKKEMQQMIETISEERKKICYECPFFSKNKNPKASFSTCTLCGCPISKKTKALSTKCPDDPARWNAVTDDEQSIYINAKMSENEEGA